MDAVNHPDHYQIGGWEAIDVIQDVTERSGGYEGYLIGNVIKYLIRYPQKNGAEDLKKARWYLNKLIVEKELEEKDNADKG